MNGGGGGSRTRVLNKPAWASTRLAPTFFCRHGPHQAVLLIPGLQTGRLEGACSGVFVAGPERGPLLSPFRQRGLYQSSVRGAGTLVG